jgi:hypothetical protein
MPDWPPTGNDGDGRTYSGDCASGQAAKTVLLHVFDKTPESGRLPKTAVIWQRFLKPEWIGLEVGDTDMALDTKKRAARKSMRQSGWITLDGGFAARQCVVHDISSSGAKIIIDDDNTLPAKLRLAFSRDARTGRNCEVVWRRGKTFGVKFVR